MDVVELNPHAPRPFVFTDLAVSLRDSIQEAGWQSTHRRNEVDPGAISLVLGCLPPFSPIVRQLEPHRTLIANFEQLGSSSVVANAQYQRWLADWVVVDYHSRNVAYLKRESWGAQRVFEVPIVPGASLALAAPTADRPVDVLFYGTPTDRRTAVIARLRQAGMVVETVAGAYGTELAPAVHRARVVLHVHFYDEGLFPVARVLQPVANGVPVVCEASVFSDLSDWSRSGILFAPYDEVVDACRALLDSPAEQAERAASAQAFVRGLRFAPALRRALQALEAHAWKPRPTDTRDG